MKTAYGFAAAAALALAFGAARADEGKSTKTTKKDVQDKIEAAGYTDVKNIHKEHGHWDATAMKDGKKVKLDYDPKTGAVGPEAEEEAEHKADKK